MAFPTQSAVFLDENPQIVMGKRADALRAKPLKPSTRLQERKALKDLSNISERKALKDLSNISERKPLQNVTNSKVPAIKEKPTLKEKSILKERPALPKTFILSDEDIKKCHEWAKDGVEGAQFTGNDSLKFDKDVQDKRVKKRVEKVLSAVQDWGDAIFAPVMYPAKMVDKFFEEVNGLELEPEILPDIYSRSSNTDNKATLDVDSFTYDELDQYPSLLDNKPVEFQLRDVSEDELDQYPFLDKKPVEFQLRDEPAIPGIGGN